MQFMRHSILVLAALAALAPSKQTAQTLSAHPQSSRCFLFRGKPTVLITAAEHYGAVMNREFDYVPYLDVLARNHLNLSRIFCFYRELEGSIPPLGYANTLAPRPGHEVLPWQRTGPGQAADGGLKFDLNKWNPEYFTRMTDFLRQAERRNIVVEVVLFCNPYNDRTWSWFPCHRGNNINQVGGGISDPKQFMEQHDPTIVDFQKSFVRKMVRELNAFDNIYFEICNETSTRVKPRDPAERQAAWHFALAEVVRQAEMELPKKHLVAVNAHQRILAYEENGKEYVETGDTAYFDHPLMDIINYHYISRKVPGRGAAVLDSGPVATGNIWAFLRARRDWKKPIVFDENYSGVIRGAPAIWDRNRMEAWETIISGGAGFDHLEWAFTPQDPTGSGKAPLPDGRRLDGARFRSQLRALVDLWNECGPDRMGPSYDLVASVPDNSAGFASSRNDGKMHVIYVGDTRAEKTGFGGPIRGAVSLRLPKGAYTLRVLHSGADKWTAVGSRRAGEAAMRIELPEFRQDYAMVLAAN